MSGENRRKIHYYSVHANAAQYPVLMAFVLVMKPPSGALFRYAESTRW